MNTGTGCRFFVTKVLPTYVLALASLLLANAPSYGGPLIYAHGESFVNDTGLTANDLTTGLPHIAQQPTGNFAKDFGSPTFATVIVVGAGFNLTWQGADATRPGTVAPGASATVFWFSGYPSDVVADGNWSFNGTDIGSLTTQVSYFNTTTNPDGTVTVSLTNKSGVAVSYSSLQIFTGADSQFFTAADFLDHLSLGSAVSLLSGVSTSGLLDPMSTTNLATFTPADGYSGWSVILDGNLLAGGMGEVPEPSSIMLFATGLVGLLSGYCRARRKNRVS